MSPPELDAELRALWLAKRDLQVEVQRSTETPQPPVPTQQGPKNGPVPTFPVATDEGGNSVFRNDAKGLEGVFPPFPLFPRFRTKEAGERWWEWSEERLQWEERAAILEFDAGLTRDQAEAVATDQTRARKDVP